MDLEYVLVILCIYLYYYYIYFVSEVRVDAEGSESVLSML